MKIIQFLQNYYPHVIEEWDSIIRSCAETAKKMTEEEIMEYKALWRIYRFGTIKDINDKYNMSLLKTKAFCEGTFEHNVNWKNPPEN